MGNHGDSDSFQVTYDNGIQTQGTFKRDSHLLILTQTANEGEDFDRINFQMSESPGFAYRGGGGLVIHID